MSDTPRTDKESFFPHDSKHKVCDANFARTLERELNAANERIKRLEEAGDAMVDDSEFIGNHDKILAWRKAKEAKP
jgi:flagellar hook-basal body complex protein FliE